MADDEAGLGNIFINIIKEGDSLHACTFDNDGRIIFATVTDFMRAVDAARLVVGDIDIVRPGRVPSKTKNATVTEMFKSSFFSNFLRWQRIRVKVKIIGDPTRIAQTAEEWMKIHSITFRVARKTLFLGNEVAKLNSIEDVKKYFTAENCSARRNQVAPNPKSGVASVPCPNPDVYDVDTDHEDEWSRDDTIFKIFKKIKSTSRKLTPAQKKKATEASWARWRSLAKVTDEEAAAALTKGEGGKTKKRTASEYDSDDDLLPGTLVKNDDDFDNYDGGVHGDDENLHVDGAPYQQFHPHLPLLLNPATHPQHLSPVAGAAAAHTPHLPPVAAGRRSKGIPVKRSREEIRADKEADDRADAARAAKAKHNVLQRSRKAAANRLPLNSGIASSSATYQLDTNPEVLTVVSSDEDEGHGDRNGSDDDDDYGGGNYDGPGDNSPKFLSLLNDDDDNLILGAIANLPDGLTSDVSLPYVDLNSITASTRLMERLDSLEDTVVQFVQALQTYAADDRNRTVFPDPPVPQTPSEAGFPFPDHEEFDMFEETP